MNRYLKTSKKEIKQLKLDLMAKSSISSQSIKDFQQLKKEELGNLFEENIRNIVKLELGWRDDELRREFSYREIRLIKKLDTYYIKNNEKKEITIDSEKYIVQHNDDTSVIIYNSKNKSSLGYYLQRQKEGAGKLDGLIPIFISKPIKIEMDGFFRANSFDLRKFNNKEIKVIYNSIKENKNNIFAYIALEVKLSKKKINEVFSQLYDDNQILKQLLYLNVLYMGIININDMNEKINFVLPKGMKIKCIILGIKDNLFGRNMLKHLDWKLINEFQLFKNQVNDKLSNLESKVDEILNILKNFLLDLKNIKIMIKI